MAPKKKQGKPDDDWENELGEDPSQEPPSTNRDGPPGELNGDSVAQQDQEQSESGGNDGAGGGLLAALQKNKNRRAKKGKPVQEFTEGEDPPGLTGLNINGNAPQEANLEEDELFSGTAQKGKTEKAGSEKTAGDLDAGKEDGGGGLKSKKEKEKEKKEREKQRKKEQVWHRLYFSPRPYLLILKPGCKEESDRASLEHTVTKTLRTQTRAETGNPITIHHRGHIGCRTCCSQHRCIR